MILDDLRNANAYTHVHPGFAAAFTMLQGKDVATLPAGKHEVDGDRLFLIINKEEGRDRSGAKLEAHRKYIDIQLVLSGDEEMGWSYITDCQQPVDAFNTERDVILFKDIPTAWFACPPGKFAIFMPEDAHAPLAGKGPLHKAVAKIAVEW